MVKPKIACYVTGGWTECGYMTHFLEKINDAFDYRQRFPQKNIGKKGKSRTNFKIDGKTGSALLSWIYNDMRNHRETFKEYRAVLIEDDMDDQFFLPSKSGRDYEKIEERERRITYEIRNILQDQKIQIFFLYALPEIESWFIADWDHTFGAEYKNVLSEMNSYFSVTFKKYVTKQVLTESYAGTELENFGYTDGEYQKLSDRLMMAYQEYSCVDEEYKNNKKYNTKINEMIKNNRILYSKKVEGRNMLQRLDPDKVSLVCAHYFAKNCRALREFNVQA